jgi:hypothetical protein
LTTEKAGLLPQKVYDAKRSSPYDRSEWDSNSFEDLQEARKNIMDISDRNPHMKQAKPAKNAGAIEKGAWHDNVGALPSRATTNCQDIISLSGKKALAHNSRRRKQVTGKTGSRFAVTAPL